MKILITMAGEGQRFKDIGLSTPKYKLKAKNKTLFEWSISSLLSFREYPFIFMISGEMSDNLFINKILKKLGIHDFSILNISNTTDGQATTALLADSLLKDTDSVGIYNIDTYVEPGLLTINDITSEFQGFIPVMKGSGPKYSYVKVDQNGYVIEVAEKIEISQLATIGFYYFKQWGDFKKIYFAKREEIKTTYKEVFIAPLYNYLIQDNKKVGIKIIDKEKVNILGTPADIILFDKYFLTKNI
ncbi:sugar phosphate nucleotidyltransferase [Bacteroidota bacterium]